MIRPLSVSVLAAALSTLANAQVTWTQVGAANAPDPFGGSAWDSARSRLVAFGGESGGNPTGTLREWNGSQWLTPPIAGQTPSVRTRPAMAFDATRGVTVMFGGSQLGVLNDETWTWNGSSWSQLAPAVRPSLRFGAAMAYDSAREVVVLFGGFVPSGTDAADLWEWDGSTWTQRTWAGPGPIARGAHRMAFDAARGVTVLYGGYSSPQQSTLSDTWTWNGTAWTQGGSGPGSLCDQVMAYDPTRLRVVLFGGLRIQTGVFTDLGATWEWNGTAWTQRSPVAAPPARNSGANAFDPVNNRLLAAGGTAQGGPFADTWAFAPVSPASASAFGMPCATSAGPLALNALSLPYLGLAFVQRIENASPLAALGLVIFGNSNSLWGGTTLPLDLGAVGAPGCSLYVSLDVAVTVTLGAGSGTVTWNLPNVPAALGASFFTQAVVFDPTSPLAFQIDASAGRGFVIGAP